MMRTLPAALLAALAVAAPAAASPNGVVISEFRFDGPNGGNDEFVEIRNTSDAAVSIGGYRLEGCAAASGAPSTRATVAPGTTLAAGAAYLFTNSTAGAYSGAVAGNATYGTGFSNTGGARIVTVAGEFIDGVGSSDGAVDECREGAGRSLAAAAPDFAFTRTRDSDDNAADFTGPSGPGTPERCDACGTPPIAFGACADDLETRIHAIQGDGAVASGAGAQRVIEGVVVGDFNGTGGLGGFFVQEEDGDADTDPGTSEGIFVVSPAAVDAGDVVRVRGTVGESFGRTQLGSVTRVEMCPGEGNVTPRQVQLPVATLGAWEALEGMAVSFAQALTISEYFDFDRFNETVLSDGRQMTPTAVYDPGSPAAEALMDANRRARIMLDDGRDAENPDPALHPDGDVFDLGHRFRGGDTVAGVTGVLDYAFGDYRVQPTAGAQYTEVDERPAEPEDVGGNVRVASFNVLNYFTTLDGRGANTPEEFARQKAKIVAAITEIDPDVVGLIEIQNNDEALQDLVDGLNEATAPGKYDFIETGKIGTDEIKVAFAYQPARVAPVGDHAILDSSVDPGFIDTKNRPALAQTFRTVDTGGIFTAVVNHLKSKGSDCDDVGDPDTGDGAGNCNLTRTAAAEALVDWLATDPTGSGDDDALIIGDLNSYDKEDPIDALLAGGYTDLIRGFQGELAYSYVFDGMIGYLDHGLASKGLADEVTGATVWHINADEPDLLDYDMTFKRPAQEALYAPDAYRSSDHDPVIVGIDACDEIAPEIDVSVTPDRLLPPNHKYVTVKATVTASDDVDATPQVRLVSATSSEPDDAPGGADGTTKADVVVVDGRTFRLRAERDENGAGRVYTVTYEVTDDCGNAATDSATVRVPVSP